jgi:hypothetical protein
VLPDARKPVAPCDTLTSGALVAGPTRIWAIWLRPFDSWVGRWQRFRSHGRHHRGCGWLKAQGTATYQIRLCNTSSAEEIAVLAMKARFDTTSS